VKKDNTDVVIGIHQEDDQVLGGHLRKNIDTGLIILEDDDEYYLIHDYFNLTKTRDYFCKTVLNKGTYHIIPITTGALLQRPFHNHPEPIEVKHIPHHYAYSTLHPYVESVIGDIFRKIDLCMNSQVDAKELNGLGRIIDNYFMKSLLQKDFTKEKFDRASCTKKGLTEFGFKTLLVKEESKTFRKVLNKLGYDEGLYSVKSRVYGLTFHSDKTLKIKREAAVGSYMDEWAWDFLMTELYYEFGSEETISKNNCECEMIAHSEIDAVSYVVFNDDD
jgi:hypothetical protein